jgi:hypothetical protein
MVDSSSDDDVTWPELIHGAIARSLDGVHTAIPAKVISYLPLLQQVKLTPVIDSMPALEDVPVLWPRGGGYCLHMPLAAGDHVLVVFCEQDFSPWRLSGSAMAPALLKRHGLFAYAIPGAAPDVQPLVVPALLTGAALGEDSPTGTVVQVTSGKCVVGLPVAVPALPVVTALELTTLLGLLKTAVSSAGAASVCPPGGPDPAWAALSAALASWGSAVGSTVLGVTS